MVTIVVGNLGNESMKANLGIEKLDILSRFLSLVFSFWRISSNFMTLCIFQRQLGFKCEIIFNQKVLNMMLFLT